MRISEWPYWVRGAFIFGAGFSPLLYEPLGYFIPLALLLNPIWTLLGYDYINHIAFLAVGGTEATAGLMDATHRFMSSVIIVSLYIVIGAIVGWLYGKIEHYVISRNNYRKRAR